jgi:hypothetical protein
LSFNISTFQRTKRDNVEKRSQCGHIITPCISPWLHLQSALLPKKKEANLVAVADPASLLRTQMVPVEGLSDTWSIIWVRADCVGGVSQAIRHAVFG